MAVDFERQLRAKIDQLQIQRAKLEAELARVDGHLSGLRQAMSLFLGEQPTAPRVAQVRPAPGSRSRTPDPARSPSWAFVLGLLRQAPAAGYHVDEIARRAEEAGHTMSRNTLRANLSNAYSERVVERVRTGRYRLPSTDAMSSAGMQAEQGMTEFPAQEDEAPDEGNSSGASSKPTQLSRLLS
jgi:multidrug efflux pump subunit AcrA (membrane-fusion protein)